MDAAKFKVDTQLIHGAELDDTFGSAVTPIYQTSTFRFRDAQHGADLFAGKEKGFIYTRIGNPTIETFERQMALLEKGYGGIACSSGMGAVSTVMLSLLSQGDHFVSTSALYGASRVLMESYLSRWGIEGTFVNTSQLDAIEQAIRPNTKLIYLETPANPTMEISDIEAISEITRKKKLILVVDNTFCSPILQTPLELGADVVLHSLTKYINGHADVVGGVIVTKTQELYEKLRKTMVTLGFNMDPHQAFLIIRGLKTLKLRMEKAQENAIKIAEYLNNHPKVEKVMYPGLTSHPQYELARKQMKGPGSMISFELKGGYEAGVQLMNSVKLILLAVSLGGVESLIQHPASMTHASVSPEAKKAAFITDGLVRLSVGIEDVDDLISDLDQALSVVNVQS
ncbi:MAG: aminotransferase class I/II-fold pyridoxal phosphate-dependent enzyme [Bacteroidales bacterium]|nr:aminotransferase class I/II-fold pyridoxal phosphate-dependent enzyme [Bacteroidales bacterium]